MMISQQADSNDSGWHTKCVKGPGNKVPVSVAPEKWLTHCEVIGW